MVQESIHGRFDLTSDGVSLHLSVTDRQICVFLF
jgi:hypothetical protein